MKAKKGFTLIELLIVIAIIGILSAALLPTILNAPARSRDTARVANMNTIVTALEAYNADNGKYPDTDGCIDGVAASDPFGAQSSVYFPAGVLTDPTSSRNVDASIGAGAKACIDGGHYYYNFIGSGNIQYVIASSMELSQNNNTDGDATGAAPPALGGNKGFALIK